MAPTEVNIQLIIERYRDPDVKKAYITLTQKVPQEFSSYRKKNQGTQQ